MGLFAEPFGAAERQDEESAHVVRREDRRQHREDPEDLVVREDVREYVTLGPESGERRDTRYGEPTYEKGGERERQILLQTTHLSHVLLAVQRVDD